MAIKVIKTSDGDKLKDTKTQRLAGSAPRKSRAPKPSKRSLAAKENKNINQAVKVKIEAQMKSDILASYRRYIAKEKNKTQIVESGNETYIFLLRRGPYGESSLGAYFSNRELKEEEEEEEEDNCVGYITWHGRDDGVIAHIEVNPEMRRRGVGDRVIQFGEPSKHKEKIISS